MNYRHLYWIPGFLLLIGTTCWFLSRSVLGMQLSDAEEQFGIVSTTYEESTSLPNPYWTQDRLQTYHYKRVRLFNGSELVYTYMDEEDGGNSYGWVEQKGKRIYWIHDCLIQVDP